MIGILGGMGTQAGLDFCNKLAILYRGKIDQKYPLFVLYNKSNIPGRPESIGVSNKRLSAPNVYKESKKKYTLVFKSLLAGCKLLEKSKCKFIVIPCNTAHYWYEDLKKKIKLPIINMPKEVFNHTMKKCKKDSHIGLLATEGTLKTGVYSKFFDKRYNLVYPDSISQKNSVNKAIKLVKMGKVKKTTKLLLFCYGYGARAKARCTSLMRRPICTAVELGSTSFRISMAAMQQRVYEMAKVT